MARIPEYTAPETILHPSNEGASAFETAGRRVASAFRVAGEEQGKAAGILGQVNVAKGEWPFTILGLEQEAAKGTGGGGFRALSSPKGGDAVSDFAPQKFPDLGAINDQINGIGKTASMLGAFDKFTQTMRGLLAPGGTPDDNTVSVMTGNGQRLVDISGGVDYGGYSGGYSNDSVRTATGGQVGETGGESVGISPTTGVGDAGFSGADFGGYGTEGGF